MHSYDIMVNMTKLPSFFRDPPQKAAIMSRNISALSDLRVQTSPIVKDIRASPQDGSKRDSNSNCNYSNYMGIEQLMPRGMAAKKFATIGT